ncbi:EAL domain-containing protein, partial [Ochrobactrum sp. SFR4]|nr:EAL domain-containing protein [Ochrobactrum sp. SFR4]
TQLSHELGFGVTIEGVETEEQLKLIRGTGGADLVQGFLLGAPLSADEISAQLGRSLSVMSNNHAEAAQADELPS